MKLFELLARWEADAENCIGWNPDDEELASEKRTLERCIRELRASLGEESESIRSWAATFPHEIRFRLEAVADRLEGKH